VLATLDEASLVNHKAFGRDLSMGRDHPIAWWRCVGKGRAFYTAMGHQAESYGEPAMRAMIAGAIDWAVRRQAPDCR
jgi:type 1 glutamine amidotransferase